MEKPALKNVTVRVCKENAIRRSEVSVIFRSEDIEAIKTVAFRYLIHYLNAGLEGAYSFLKSKSLKWTDDAFELQIREEDYRDHEALMYVAQQYNASQSAVEKRLDD